LQLNIDSTCRLDIRFRTRTEKSAALVACTISDKKQTATSRKKLGFCSMKIVNGSNADVHEANLNYLTSAKKLAAEDKNEAIKRFGLTEESAELLTCLSLLQVVHLAESNVLLSHIVFNDHVIGQVLTGKKIRHQTNRSVDTFGPINNFPWLSLSTDDD
jgi:hypothetical protein